MKADADRAFELMQEGYTFVDVRSEQEFERGHPEGAWNVPLMHSTPSGMAPNRDFLAVMEQHFAKDARLIVACQRGGRSARAVAALEQEGYTEVVDMYPGWGGYRDGTPGWESSGLPIEQGAPEGRSYLELKAALED